MKPMLASDWDGNKVRFPVIAQPKIDGVRGINTTGMLTGRSLKPHANRYATAFFSKPEYTGFDGELAAGDERDSALCRKTSSALSRIDGSPFVLWHVFDRLTPDAINLTYLDRLALLDLEVHVRQVNGLATHLRVIPWVVCKNMEALIYHDTVWLDQGYEGTILRDPDGMHKQGRSTVKEGGLLRIKRFVEDDAVVLSIEEGRSNQNDAQTNELGQTFRTTHQDNMVPNGLVGSLLCKDVKTGNEITVSAGSMDHDMRKHYFENPKELLGQVIKYKHFPKGVKDKPRFPTFQSIRLESDRS